MRRRDVLAGVGSLGVLGGAGVLASRGLPSSGTDGGSEPVDPGQDGEDGGPAPPFTVETVDAPGSEAGTVTVPGENDVMAVMFFMPTCGICQDMMSVHGRVRNAVDDDRVTFLGALHPNYANTTDMTASELASWWVEYDGNWPVGIAPTELVDYYDVFSHPITTVFDADGEQYLSAHGYLERDAIVDPIEEALAAVSDDDEDASEDANEAESDDEPATNDSSEDST